MEGEANGDDLHEVVVVRYSLRIMIINPTKKRDYIMVKADKTAAKAIGFNEMKRLILSSFPCDVPQPQIDKLEFGYIEPGHGLKGKKEWILDDNDMKEFLEKYQSKNKKEFTLWCYSHGPSHCKEGKRGSKRSRSKSPTVKPGSSRYDAHIAKMAKVDEIYKKIDETHGNLYSPEQKRAWAHLIELGKHESITCPPKKRFFQSPSTSTSSSSGSPSASTPTCSTATTAATSTCSTATCSSPSPFVSSPGRRVSIRSECIDQLQKWHSLLDCGAITKEQYDELQSTILSDIKKLTSNVQ